MRLICPNCGAKYKIDSGLLPKGGRDVQCSACGHTWFQRPDTLEDDLAREMGAAIPQDDEEGATEAPRAEPPEQPAVAAPPHHSPDVEDDDEEDTHEHPAPAARHRRPDDAALAILREEAEREAEARRREAAGMETQGDLGLDDAPPRPRRPAAVGPGMETATTGRGETSDEPEPEQGAGPRPRRERAPGSAVFPDIDEINSSLTAADVEAGNARLEEEREQARSRGARRGFRLAFLTVVIFASILIVLYAYAPQIANTFPDARPYLADYVDWANQKRDQLDGLMQSATAMISSP